MFLKRNSIYPKKGVYNYLENESCDLFKFTSKLFIFA